MMSSQIRSLNLLDFSVNKESDVFMVDIFNDQTQFGGLTETELKIVNMNEENCCKAVKN